MNGLRLDYLDHLLKTLYDDHVFRNRAQLIYILKNKFPEEDFSDSVDVILEKLQRDGYLISQEVKAGGLMRQAGVDSYTLYSISFDGIIFTLGGGYLTLLSKQQSDRIFQERKMEMELQQIKSGIETNKSVISVNRLFWAILIASIMGGVGTLGSFILELRKEQQKPLKELPVKRTDTLRKDQAPIKISGGNS